MNSNIVIDGNIGSGKSTILNLLKTKNKCNIITEDLEAWTPYLNQFYNDMSKHGLSFQMKVLLHHLKNHKNINSVLERSPLSCIHIFGQNLLNNRMLSSLDFKLLEEYNQNFGWYPEYLIYIKTDPEICLQRINQRSRDGETIPLEYLKQIDNLYNLTYQNISVLEEKKIYTKIITINGNRDKEEVYRDVLNTINQIKK